MPRRAVAVIGTVQGVGFRPYVYRLATKHCLGGFVRNQAGVVQIEVEGCQTSLEQFRDELSLAAPPQALIRQVSWQLIAEIGEQRFRIEDSSIQAVDQPVLPADTATCPDCLAEMRDPADRRFGYPFVNCTNCGPRLTIVRSAPYDRTRTTMARFAMCADCEREYEDPNDRRFHAQPIACPRCGPQLRLLSPTGDLPVGEPLRQFAQTIASGGIGALKGLGGYHLVCDATNELAVRRLRERKHRDAKPLAIMLRDLDDARRFCFVDKIEQMLLEGARRPIVLLKRRVQLAASEPASAEQTIAASVAGSSPTLGTMLPYTPLHHLLIDELNGLPLVMTSGNRSDEPIAYDDQDALARLGDIADVFLMHDRPIHVRCDDSVVRVIDGCEYPLRRSRGYAPEPIALPIELTSDVLAVGGQLKGSFAVGKGRLAFVSQHLGDLDHWPAYQAFERDVQLYEDLMRIKPELIVHDLHPDYATTRYARSRGEHDGCRTLAVQHHHAHIVSCLAENGLRGPAIGVAMDGTGYGDDGAIWGGEFLVVDGGRARRAAHLRYVPLAGGDQAIRQPWRVALAHLLDAGAPLDSIASQVPQQYFATVRQMIERRLCAPFTSSAGRLFDAVAAIVGLRSEVAYEAQAAVELEWAAASVTADTSYQFRLDSPPITAAGAPVVVDTRAMIRRIAAEAIRGVPLERIARRFHSTMVEIVTAVCQAISDETGLRTVALSGGVFANAILLTESIARLTEAGFEVIRHRQVPTNDAGLCLGQLAIAAALEQSDSEPIPRHDSQSLVADTSKQGTPLMAGEIARLQSHQDLRTVGNEADRRLEALAGDI